MFVLALLADTIRIPPHLLAQPTLTSVTTEIEKRYPNRIIVDVGLVVCPYGPPLEVGDGVLVPGDGGAHHQVVFRAVVFRPFVEEVVVGTVTGSHAGGLAVRVGEFFDHVTIPAHWMLNPSVFDAETGLWVWTPTYDEDDDEGVVKKEADDVDAAEDEAEPGEGRFEIEIGAEIRFKVKAVNFTRITTTMKGVQATTTTTSHATDRAFGLKGGDGAAVAGTQQLRATGADHNAETGGAADDGEVRRRSSSADLSDSENHPAPMQIMGSICEDGLGLMSWWKTADDEEEDEEEEEEAEAEAEE